MSTKLDGRLSMSVANFAGVLDYFRDDSSYFHVRYGITMILIEMDIWIKVNWT